MGKRQDAAYKCNRKYYLILPHSCSYPLKDGEGHTSPAFTQFDIYGFFPIEEKGFFSGWTGVDYRRVFDIEQGLTLRMRPLPADSRDYGRVSKWLSISKRGIVNDDAKYRARGEDDKRPRVNGTTAIKTEEELIFMLLEYMER